MERIVKKLHNLIVSVGEQFIVASVQGFHAIIFAILTVPECISSLASLGQLAWDQLSSPSPHAPAGDLSLHLIKIWTNHVVEVMVPQVRSRATRFDFAISRRFAGEAGPVWSIIGMCCRLCLSVTSFSVRVQSCELKPSRREFNFCESAWRLGVEE